MKIRNPELKCLECLYSYYDTYGDLKCSRHVLLDKQYQEFICLTYCLKQRTCSNCKYKIEEEGQMYCTDRCSKTKVMDYECCSNHRLG